MALKYYSHTGQKHSSKKTFKEFLEWLFLQFFLLWLFIFFYVKYTAFKKTCLGWLWKKVVLAYSLYLESPEMFSSPAKASLNLIRNTDTSKFSGSGKSFFQITPGKYLLFIYQTFLLNEKTNNWKIKSINLFQISTKYYFYMCSAKFENNLLWILHRTSNTLKANYLKFSEMNKKFLNLFLRGVWKFINQRDFFYFWVFWICKGWTLMGCIHNP